MAASPGGVKAGTRLVKVMINGQSVNFRPELTSFLVLSSSSSKRSSASRSPWVRCRRLYGANAFVATVNVIT